MTQILDPSTGDVRGRRFILEADGVNSQIDLSSLQNFFDTSTADWDGGDGISHIIARNDGEILAPLLTDIRGTTLNLSGGGDFPIDQISQFSNGHLIVGGVDRSFPSLTNANNTNITVSAATERFPSQQMSMEVAAL